MKRSLVALFSAFALLSCSTGPLGPQGHVDRAVQAMGGADALAGLKTVSAKGTTRQWEPEQSDAPGGEMRYANEARFETIADRSARASRIDYVKNFAYPAPRTFTYSEIVTPQAGYVIGIDTNGRNAQSMKANPPAHTMSGLRLASTQRESRRANSTALLLDMRNNPTRVRPAADISHNGRSLPAVAFDDFIVAFDPRTGLPELVRTLDYDNVWGDVTYDMHYSDWQEIQGVKVPMTRRMELNGRLIAHTSLSEVRYNQPVDTARLQIPAGLLATAAKPATGPVPHQWVLRRQFIGTYMDSDNVTYDTQASPAGLRLADVAPGVSHTQGGTHHSMIVELRDYLVVYDAPVTDAQSMWVVNAARAKYPNKPIRYLVLTHHHMDHIGGLRGYLAQGAALVVGQGTADHYRRVLAAPATRNPDLKVPNLSGTQIIEVKDAWTVSDGSRQAQAFLMDSPHAKGTVLGYVPHARLGFVTDIWSPGVPFPPKPNPGLVAVVTAVKKANIQPERFVGGHGTASDYNLLTRFVGQ